MINATAPARSAASVLKVVGCSVLSLYKGDGYWYFSFDALDDGGPYETYSVMTMRLNDMSLARWVEIGRAFVADVEAGTFSASSAY